MSKCDKKSIDLAKAKYEKDIKELITKNSEIMNKYSSKRMNRSNSYCYNNNNVLNK
jgi:hypothetical protein